MVKWHRKLKGPFKSAYPLLLQLQEGCKICHGPFKKISIVKNWRTVSEHAIE